MKNIQRSQNHGSESWKQMFDRMDKDLNEDPMYWTGAAFFSGFLFSTWSWGIVYLVLFLVIYEILYYGYCRCFGNMSNYSLMIRIGLVAGVFMGFLMGRVITNQADHDENIRQFSEYFKKK